MTYREWYGAFARRHRAIVEKLPQGDPEAILEAFGYENMRREHPEFCPLYKEGVKCHDLEDLNCYLCGCPHFRYCDEGIDQIEGKIRYSLCAIEAREGKTFETDTAIHQDCSDCPLPHLHGFIRRHFDPDWGTVMATCGVCPEGEKTKGGGE